MFPVDDQQVGDPQVKSNVHDELDDLKDLGLSGHHRLIRLLLGATLTLNVCEKREREREREREIDLLSIS